MQCYNAGIKPDKEVRTLFTATRTVHRTDNVPQCWVAVDLSIPADNVNDFVRTVESRISSGEDGKLQTPTGKSWCGRDDDELTRHVTILNVRTGTT
jgi:hypothetical protein